MEEAFSPADSGRINGEKHVGVCQSVKGVV